MMKSAPEKRSLTGLSAILLLCLFAGTALFVLLAGAGAYRRIAQGGQEQYDSRTGLQYLATRVRQAPHAGALELTRFGDGACLVIRERIGEADYLTRVYCFEGWLMELFTADVSGFAPEDGEKLLPASALELELEQDRLRIALTDAAGETQSLQLTLRGREGAP